MEDRSLVETNEEQKPALIFDADSISLAGTFTDELAAYRARRTWDEVLAKHFLLEKTKDYEMKVARDESDPFSYQLKCCFHSACGRYAFWRLVNHQAPDVEGKLLSTNMVSKKSARFLLGSLWNNNPSNAWIYNADAQIESATDEVRSTTSVLKSLLKYFNKSEPT